jgi:hypothetical protein
MPAAQELLESAHHLLEAEDIRGWQEGGIISGGRELGGGTVLWRGPRMWRVLGLFGKWVLEPVKCPLDVPRHVEVDSAGTVIPFECQAALFAACPVGGDWVQLPKTLKHVLGVVAANVLDTKVVHHQKKDDRAGLVCEEAKGMGDRSVPMGEEVGLEPVVGYNAGLGQAVHALPDLYKDFVVVDQWGELVLLEDV